MKKAAAGYFMVFGQPFLDKLVLKMNILLCKNWVANQEGSVQVFVVHVYRGNLVIFVGCVVVDSFGGVAAGGVEGDFVFAFCYFAAASLLVC